MNLLALIPQHGTCGVCSDQALLTHCDRSRTIAVGKCCLISLMTAEAMIAEGKRYGGLRDPEVGEFQNLGH